MERFYSYGRRARNIIVTGGSGFLGQQLLEVCSKKGHRLVNIDLNAPRNGANQDVPYLQADLSDTISTNRAFAEAKRFLDGKIDDVFHLAAVVSYTLPYSALEGPNVRAVYNVAKECTFNDAFLIHMSGTAVLGHVDVAMREDHPLNPVENYGLSKAHAEYHIYRQSISNGLKAIIFRSTAPVGPGLETAGINNLYKMILNQKVIPANKGSNVTYVSTKDIARAFLFAAENQDKVRHLPDSWSNLVYNLGVHKPFSDKEMAEHLIASIVGEGKKKIVELPHWLVYAGSHFIRTGNLLANAGRIMAGNRRQEPELCPSLANLIKGPHFQDYTKFEKYFENNGFKFEHSTPEEALDTGVVYKFQTDWSHLEPPERTKRLIEKELKSKN